MAGPLGRAGVPIAHKSLLLGEEKCAAFFRSELDVAKDLVGGRVVLLPREGVDGRELEGRLAVGGRGRGAHALVVVDLPSKSLKSLFCRFRYRKMALSSQKVYVSLETCVFSSVFPEIYKILERFLIGFLKN